MGVAGETAWRVVTEKAKVTEKDRVSFSALAAVAGRWRLRGARGGKVWTCE
jgi:hypothetical protein